MSLLMIFKGSQYEKLKGLWKKHLYKDHLFIQVTQNPIPRMTFHLFKGSIDHPWTKTHSELPGI